MVQTLKNSRTFAAEMGKVADYISSIFRNGRKYYTLRSFGYEGWNFGISTHKFGETIFYNIVEMLTDIYTEVEWLPLGEVSEKYKAWKSFLQRNGQRILVQLLTGKGYAVIGYKQDVAGLWHFWQLHDMDYTTTTIDNTLVVQANDPSISCYILRSPSFEALGQSDRQLCEPYIRLLDNVLNATNTITEQLGVVVVASPNDPSSSPMSYVLSEDDKKEIEESLQKEYGALKNQKRFMLLPRSMNFQTINLAGLDTRLQEKTRTAILAIADRLKVPANQIAIIDANSSKSLSNGSELREGDMAKYRQFRRLLNATYFDMAYELGFRVDYTIENEPKSVQGQSIEQV